MRTDITRKTLPILAQACLSENYRCCVAFVSSCCKVIGLLICTHLFRHTRMAHSPLQSDSTHSLHAKCNTKKISVQCGVQMARVSSGKTDALFFQSLPFPSAPNIVSIFNISLQLSLWFPVLVALAPYTRPRSSTERPALFSAEKFWSDKRFEG